MFKPANAWQSQAGGVPTVWSMNWKVAASITVSLTNNARAPQFSSLFDHDPSTFNACPLGLYLRESLRVSDSPGFGIAGQAGNELMVKGFCIYVAATIQIGMHIGIA